MSVEIAIFFFSSFLFEKPFLLKVILVLFLMFDQLSETQTVKTLTLPTDSDTAERFVDQTKERKKNPFIFFAYP